MNVLLRGPRKASEVMFKLRPKALMGIKQVTGQEKNIPGKRRVHEKTQTPKRRVWLEYRKHLGRLEQGRFTRGIEGIGKKNVTLCCVQWEAAGTAEWHEPTRLYHWGCLTETGLQRGESKGRLCAQSSDHLLSQAVCRE